MSLSGPFPCFFLFLPFGAWLGRVRSCTLGAWLGRVRSELDLEGFGHVLLGLGLEGFSREHDTQKSKKTQMTESLVALVGMRRCGLL